MPSQVIDNSCVVRLERLDFLGQIEIYATRCDFPHFTLQCWELSAALCIISVKVADKAVISTPVSLISPELIIFTLIMLFNFFFPCSAWDQTQDLLIIRQVLCHWVLTPNGKLAWNSPPSTKLSLKILKLKASNYPTVNTNNCIEKGPQRKRGGGWRDIIL